MPSPLVGRRYFKDLNAKDPEWANHVVDLQELASSSMIILADAFDRQGRHRASARVEMSLIYFMLRYLEPNDTTPLLAHISNLASQFRDMGKYKEAETLYRFAIREWPASHAQTATQLPRLKGSLAVTLSRMGKYEDVAILHTEMSSLQTGDSTEPSEGKVMETNNRAVNLFRQEKYSEAEALHRSVLAYREKTLGPEHPHTCLTLNGLANALEKQNKLPEAEEMHKRALQGRKAIFPEGHIAILRSMNNLAVTLKKRGKLVEAAKQYSEALDGYVRWQGEDHEETIRTRKNLAVVWAVQTDFAKAAPELATCAKQLASTLGIEYPVTLGAINDWANILIDLGRLKGASNLFWYVLQVRLRVCVNDKALRNAFEGLGSVRRQYARRGKMNEVKELDKKVPKHEALLLTKLGNQAR
jgi:tetratricopeptide (TPR) repeat protein